MLRDSSVGELTTLDEHVDKLEDILDGYKKGKPQPDSNRYILNLMDGVLDWTWDWMKGDITGKA